MKHQPRRVDEPLAPHLLPEFRRPAPCDRVFVPAPRAITPGGPRVVVGPTARAAFATYSDLGRRYRLEGFSKSPHSVVRKLWRNSIPRITVNRATGDQTLNVNDDTNTARTLRLLQNDDEGPTVNTVFNANTGTTQDQARLKYGTGSTAATENDVNIQTQAGNVLNANSVQYDDTNFVLAVAGSELFPSASALVAEVAQFQRYNYGGRSSGNAQLANILLDRTLLATPVLVSLNQTAAVSYVWQF